MPLIVKRTVGESIQIGDNVTVRVVAMVGGKVILEVIAPQENRVWRAEKAPSPPVKRQYTISDDMGSTTTAMGFSPVDAFMAFAKEWPFTIAETPTTHQPQE